MHLHKTSVGTQTCFEDLKVFGRRELGNIHRKFKQLCEKKPQKDKREGEKVTKMTANNKFSSMQADFDRNHIQGHLISDMLKSIRSLGRPNILPPITTPEMQAKLDFEYTSVRRKVFDDAINPQKKRLILRMRTENLKAASYFTSVSHWNSASNTIDEIFPSWEDDKRILLRAIDVNRMPGWVNIILDIHNYDYDPSTAHLCETVIPIYKFKSSRQPGTPKISLSRWPPGDEYVTKELAKAHMKAHMMAKRGLRRALIKPFYK
ncbi:hypothetical protein N7490_001183 [Penicillium lividum]|nr:hypothetical protein N7490_001183 [Penicillium lividum]